MFNDGGYTLKMCCCFNFLFLHLLSLLAYPMLMFLDVSQQVLKGAEMSVQLQCCTSNVPKLIEQMMALCPPGFSQPWILKMHPLI